MGKCFCGPFGIRKKLFKVQTFFRQVWYQPDCLTDLLKGWLLYFVQGVRIKCIQEYMKQHPVAPLGQNPDWCNEPFDTSELSYRYADNIRWVAPWSGNISEYVNTVCVTVASSMSPLCSNPATLMQSNIRHLELIVILYFCKTETVFISCQYVHTSLLSKERVYQSCCCAS